jgi:hypothetical protein
MNAVNGTGMAAAGYAWKKGIVFGAGAESMV